MSALSIADADLVALEIHVLHAEPERFQQPQAGAVQKAHDQALRAAQLRQNRADLGWSQDHGHAARLAGADDAAWRIDLDAEHVPVQEQHGACRLILRRRAGVSVVRQVREERAERGAVEFGGVPLPVEEHVPTDPGHVRLLGTGAVLPCPDRAPHLLEQLGLPPARPGLAAMSIDHRVNGGGRLVLGSTRAGPATAEPHTPGVPDRPARDWMPHRMIAAARGHGHGAQGRPVGGEAHFVCLSHRFVGSVQRCLSPSCVTCGSRSRPIRPP